MQRSTPHESALGSEFHLSRRGFLALSGGLSLTGLMAGCGSPVASGFTATQPATADVIFWHLFGGGDGANMGAMVSDYQRRSGVSVEATLLSWGNPYYTKLALSTSSGRPPDVAIGHLSRLPLLARAGLLSPLGEEFTRAGITEDQFTPAAWQKATVDDQVYAVPLDTHPFVLYYNRDLADKAGLLDPSAEKLKPMRGREDFLDALRAMKEASGGDYGAVATITTDPSTCWRLFLMTYSGIADPLLTDLGATVSIDDTAMQETFAFLQSLTGSEQLMPNTATPPTSSSLFSQGRVGFLFDGVWQLPTYREVEGLDFGMEPFPALLGDKAVAYADSHALIVPASDGRSVTRSDNSVSFVKGMLERSLTWSQGGHVPAWLPVQKGQEFAKLDPQSNYTDAAFNAIYDPPGWYTGAGSDFQTAMGSIVAGVLQGGLSPRAGVNEMRTRLAQFADARPPVQ